MKYKSLGERKGNDKTLLYENFLIKLTSILVLNKYLTFKMN